MPDRCASSRADSINFSHNRFRRSLMPEQPKADQKPDQFTLATQALTHIFLKTSVKPTLGIILGSGLGNFASQVENPAIIPYEEIPGWPLSTVEGHSGKLVLGTIAGVGV